jgi:hypothetical protein
MSLNSAAREADSTSGAGRGLELPLLVAGRYAEWRPRMENALMRAGIAARDYKVANPEWAALVEAVEQWEQAEESASIALALGRASGTAASASAVTAGPSAATKEARRGATEAVARGKRAYTLLYQVLPDELRRLVAHVPQGDAYGLWSWLEKRYQSTEQDNVGDLWDQFTALCQADEESFDEYKARVDAVYGLLAHAKDKPSAGLYAHRLLWKLSARYNPAVLALKASGKLKEAEKINWDEIVAFVNNHERSEHRLAGADADGQGAFGMAATTGYGGRHGDRRGIGGRATTECYNCGEKGHLARNCKKPRRARQYEEANDVGESTRPAGASSTSRRGGARRNEHAAVAAAFALTSDSDGEDTWELGHRSFSVMATNTQELPEKRPHDNSKKEAADADGRGRPRPTARRNAHAFRL